MFELLKIFFKKRLYLEYPHSMTSVIILSSMLRHLLRYSLQCVRHLCLQYLRHLCLRCLRHLYLQCVRHMSGVTYPLSEGGNLHWRHQPLFICIYVAAGHCPEIISLHQIESVAIWCWHRLKFNSSDAREVSLGRQIKTKQCEPFLSLKLENKRQWLLVWPLCF